MNLFRRGVDMYPESKKLMVLVFSTRFSFLLSNHLTRFEVPVGCCDSSVCLSVCLFRPLPQNTAFYGSGYYVTVCCKSNHWSEVAKTAGTYILIEKILVFRISRQQLAGPLRAVTLTWFCFATSRPSASCKCLHRWHFMLVN